MTTNSDVEKLREYALRAFNAGRITESVDLHALADRMEKVEPISPDCYWEPDCCEISYSNVLDYVNDCGACWVVGDTFNMSEAHYLDAEFRITKVRNDETDDEYEVERISGKNIYTTPLHVATSEPTPFIGAENQADGASLVWQPIETAPDETLVWLCEKGRGIWIGSREYHGEGWGWCNSYGNFFFNGERFEGDAEYDDDYQPTLWCPLPPAPVQGEKK